MIKIYQKASIVIPTKNRKEELRDALHSVQKQSVHPEVIVLDDASTDGTADMVKNEFPEIRFIRTEKPIGAAAQRNLGTRLAKYPIVVSIDDDMKLPNPTTIEQTLKYFDHPRVGIVTIPYININAGTKVYQQTPDEDNIYVNFTFGAGGYAVRKDIFLNLNGYREIFFMSGEEQDLSIRMLDRGYVVRLGRAPPIQHFLSPKRESTLRFLLARRNHILFPWFNAPDLILLIHLMGTCLNNIKIGWRRGKFWLTIKGLLKGFISIFSEWSSRDPVSLTTYKLFRMIRNQGYIPLDEFENQLNQINVRKYKTYN